MSGKPVTGGNVIQRGGRIVTAAVLTTCLAKDGHHHVLAAGSAKQTHTKALYNKRCEIQFDTVGNLKNKTQHPVRFIAFNCCTETCCPLRVFPRIITVIVQFCLVIPGKMIAGVRKVPVKKARDCSIRDSSAILYTLY